ncbi:DrmB family protein [Kitasatospora sp. NPDC088391]|uniref:DrmB family protein n=1 Tax=Kitasatospora sp. NPDC088391 TaxID=3364074 RepID=UPI0037F7FAF5
MSDETRFVYDVAHAVDPLGDLEQEAEKAAKHNRAKVGSARPSSLLYTYGPGAIMDLPQFTIMPTGLDDWDRIWARRDSAPPQIHAPRLRDVVRMTLRSPDVQLRPFPWQPKKNSRSAEGNDLGVPARVFPQWLRCTGCDLLGLLSQFDYRNTHPYRTDLAVFEHTRCTGRAGSAARKATRRTAVPARYLLACPDGHLDEFPYDQWVHRGRPCAKAELPTLKMVDRLAGKGASAVIHCASCDLRRPMNEAQGEVGREKLPDCRGRHPHLDAFEPKGCLNKTRLMLVGASNLWFPATWSIIVMPDSPQEKAEDLADRVRTALGDNLAVFRDQPAVIRALLDAKNVDVTKLTDQELEHTLQTASAPTDTPEEQERKLRDWDPVDLLVPEWQHLLRDIVGLRAEEPRSGLTLATRERGPDLRPEITRVLAVERLRKVNALVGFTRIDDMDRVGDLPRRLAPLTRSSRPAWTVATEDRGEGIFLQLDENKVAAWEKHVEDSAVWAHHKEAHRRNFERRFSETADQVNHLTRLKPPRYWLVHSFAHVLIRELALTCGYAAASLSERLYAWPAAEGRDPAAGLLICTTASDSDGTLGGLVQLSEPTRLQQVVNNALRKATRCSSDPICAMRTPQDPEDFLHGAACHCCVMASETSCERANRFLDRRFLVHLPGSTLGFFEPHE